MGSLIASPWEIFHNGSFFPRTTKQIELPYGTALSLFIIKCPCTQNRALVPFRFTFKCHHSLNNTTDPHAIIFNYAFISKSEVILGGCSSFQFLNFDGGTFLADSTSSYCFFGIWREKIPLDKVKSVGISFGWLF